MSGRIVSTPSGESITSQQGGGSTPDGHECSLPTIHPRRCSTIDSGDVKSLFETMPVVSQNVCGVLKASDVEIKSAANRRVRKSRGEQAGSRHATTITSDILAIRMTKEPRARASTLDLEARAPGLARNALARSSRLEPLSREDSNELLLALGQKRSGCDLVIELVRPTPRNLRVAGRAVAVGSQLVFFDPISEAADQRLSPIVAMSVLILADSPRKIPAIDIAQARLAANRRSPQ